jgi:phospholipid-binding lipoprotein MlaA
MSCFNNLLLTGALLCNISGCATNHPKDPLEKVNRGVYSLNKMVDRAVLKPVAKVYDTAVPDPIDTGISNFFSNLNDVVVIFNDLMQLKLKQATQDSGRFMLNTTVGFFGFFDPATKYGLSKHNEDFGQTLGYWGVKSGPYLVLPVFGPSSLRDAPGLMVDMTIDPRMQIGRTGTQNTLYGTTALNIVDNRAGLLSAEKLLDTAALDEYVFMRDAYLQRRENFVTDGQSVENAISDDELFDDL